MIPCPLPITAVALRTVLTGYRLPVADESLCQLAVGSILTRHGIPFVAEHDLPESYGRIDFYLPGPDIGLELKVKGSPSEVMRQLHRYALAPPIRELVLLTGRARLSGLPPTLNGKPLTVVSLWEGLL